METIGKTAILHYAELIEKAEYLEDALEVLDVSELDANVCVKNWLILVEMVKIKFKVKLPAAINYNKRLLNKLIDL